MGYWKSKTNVGRVVYERPKHLFTMCDALRIVKKITPTFSQVYTEKQLICAMQALTRIMVAIQSIGGDAFELLRSENPEIEENAKSMFGQLSAFSGFGGGEFGGAGATRKF